MKKYFSKIKKTVIPFQVGLFLFVMPASTTYQMKDFGFGSGGTSGATSTTYSMQAISGEDTAGKLNSTTYSVGAGLAFENQAGVPGAPTFINPSNYYNKLKLVVDTGGNPSDTKYAIAISTDNFVTTNFVQSDNTIGSILNASNRQTFTAWGGAGGILIIGLTANTTYKVKVNAMRGKLTETEYSIVSTAATISPTLSFGVSPNTVNFGNLIPNTINSSPQITATFATNAENGGRVYVSSANAGLYSTGASYKINAMSADLSGQAEGFGAQGVLTSQSSGGPLVFANIYNNIASNTVGIVNGTIQDLMTTTVPIVGGSGVFMLKAKPSSTAPAASDYAEILTVIASASF